MTRKAILACMFAGVSLVATPAMAGEIYGGIYAHAVDTPFTLDTQESGTDIQAGYRLDPVGGPLRLQPYVFGSVNSDGGTDFIGAGISRKFSLGPVYVRPGVGLVVHNAPSTRVNPDTGYRTDLGSRVLFEPEIAVGTQIAPRLTVEASWVHISNARLFDSQQNPGIDMIGVRANLHL
ncbi:MAG: acyloxyacyl hydrolase [Tsuneonella suprasediminis]|uniref:Acyloxyacyl hydrolase n=1 Tax=Tsuneonella suprasediminis TaxID=2306996 RepID=A0A419R1D2_9SPHN|nr:acyloxyacyl hydrolase [Tsuneonella suprasediminis]RJX67760.1 acyloxyacyl hydrolase [Tsuneonella suprasediminis]UBS33296.1 acyloxyacyl hydrolase [Altererythrobacter sp. N1]